MKSCSIRLGLLDLEECTLGRKIRIIASLALLTLPVLVAIVSRADMTWAP